MLQRGASKVNRRGALRRMGTSVPGKTGWVGVSKNARIESHVMRTLNSRTGMDRERGWRGKEYKVQTMAAAGKKELGAQLTGGVEGGRKWLESKGEARMMKRGRPAAAGAAAGGKGAAAAGAPAGRLPSWWAPSLRQAGQAIDVRVWQVRGGGLSQGGQEALKLHRERSRPARQSVRGRCTAAGILGSSASMPTCAPARCHGVLLQQGCLKCLSSPRSDPPPPAAAWPRGRARPAASTGCGLQGRQGSPEAQAQHNSSPSGS